MSTGGGWFAVHHYWKFKPFVLKEKNIPQEEKEQDPFQTFFNVPSELYMSYDVSE